MVPLALITAPLSFEQAASLAQSRDSPADEMRVAVLRLPSFDGARLVAALQAWIARHDVLRIRLVDEGSGRRQRFLAPSEVKLQPRVFARPAEVDDEADVAVGVASKLVAERLDLENDGPFRVVVARGRGGPAHVGVAVHDVAFDALSFYAAVDELEALLTGTSVLAPADDPPPSYAAYVDATVGRTRASRVAANTEWWIAQTGRVAFDSLRLAAIPPGPSASEFGPMREDGVRLPPTAVVEATARRLGQTPAALLLAAMAGAITSLTAGSGAVLISTPATPGRAFAPSGLRGHLTMPLPLVVDVTGDRHADARGAGAALADGMLRWSYSFEEWRAAMRERLTGLAAPPLSVIFVHRRVDDRTKRTAVEGSAQVRVRSSRTLRPDHLELWFEEGPETFVAFLRSSSTWLPQALADELCQEVARRVEDLVA